MLFADSEEQALIRQTARAYFADKYPAERLYAIERGDSAVAASDVRELADLGWLALFAPADAGGGGIAMLDAAVVIDECGYAAAPVPLAASNVAADLLSRRPGFAGDVTKIASGTTFVSVASGTRLRGGAAGGGLVADGRRLRGELRQVPFGNRAAVVLAPLRVDGDRAFAAVALDGCARDEARTLDRRDFAHLRFDGDASLARVMATGAEAEAMHERCDALFTAFAVVETAGMLQRVLEMTVEYISQRVQFGQPIAKFQAARHRAAELLMQAETVRWTAYHALWRFQEDDRDTREIWLAKHWAIRAVERTFQVSHLLHGGVGVGTDYPLHLYTQAMSALAVRAGGMGEMVDRTLEPLGVAAARR